MNLKSLIKNISKNTCIIFTVFTALYCIISAIINVDDSVVSLEVSRLILFFVASILFAMANGVFKLEKMHVAAKFILHYIFTLFAFWTCMLLPLELEGSTAIVGVALFSVLYLVVTLVVSLIKSRYKKNADADAEYTPQYKKKK